MSIMNINEFEITHNKRICKKSPIFLEAMRRLRKERKYINYEYEEVYNPFELILKCYEVSEEANKKRGNTNAKRV